MTFMVAFYHRFYARTVSWDGTTTGRAFYAYYIYISAIVEL